MLTHGISRYPSRAAPSLWRRLAASTLRGASRLLHRLARHISRDRHEASTSDPLFEFHAEAGAPEGAVYVNGQLIGHVPGVTRL